MASRRPSSRLLVLHQGALGDLVVSFGPLLALKSRFETIDGICSRGIGKVAEEFGVFGKSYPQESALFSSLYSDLPSKPLSDMLSPYDAILLFSFSDALQKNISGNYGKRVYRIRPRPDVRERKHVAEHLFQSLYACGLLMPADRKSSDFLDRPRVDPDPSRILIHPGSGSRKKNWPLERFMEVSRRIEREGYNPVFLLGPAEEEIRGQISEEVFIPSDLPALVRILKGAGGYIGNDSGVSHLAAFIGLPVLVIFGPSDHLRWKPVGRAVRAVAPEIECVPCFETGERICRDENCLDGIDSGAVLSAFTVLKEKADGPLKVR